MPTLHGEVAGTPHYMAPEQAAGLIEQIGPWSDVYALGIILYEIMSGAPPFSNERGLNVVHAVINHSPPSLKTIKKQGIMVPDDLVMICEAALHPDYTKRIQNAGELATQLREWLNGAKRRERALEEVKKAELCAENAIKYAHEASSHEIRAKKLLEDIPSWSPASLKLSGWRAEDEATRLREESRRLQAAHQRGLRAALSQEPTLPEAHRNLSHLLIKQHQIAEKSRQWTLAQTLEEELHVHLNHLPLDDSQRVDYEVYLRGTGQLHLHLPEIGEIKIYRYTRIDRHLKPQEYVTYREKSLTTELPIGSYLAEITTASHHLVRYPFYIERDMPWNCIPPESVISSIIPLPNTKENLDGHRYVPEGWFYSGGDHKAPNGVEERRVWVDGFVIKDAPVTHREYLEFLNDLSIKGQEQDATRWMPREQTTTTDQGKPIYQVIREADSIFFQYPKGEEFLDYPLVSVCWYSAIAYCKWLSERDGLDWRLPLELEFEKAARGVDRRCFPWGDDFDPSFCVMMDSHEGELQLHRSKSYHMDCSVYGVWDCAGNIREWCLDKYHSNGAPILNDRPRFPTTEEMESDDFKSSRGGSLGNAATRTRSADRDWWLPNQTYQGRGFRVARSWPKTSKV